MTQGPQRGAATRDRRELLAGFAVAALGFALYLPTLGHEFVNWDDVEYLTSNPNLVAFDGRFIRWAFSTWWYANWHPITWLSYGLDLAIWGMHPRGFHLTNLLFHAANCGLVLWLALRLFRRAGVGRDQVGRDSVGRDSVGRDSVGRDSVGRDAGLFAATVVGALFAAHPLHVESVAWVSERKDVLYAFFTLLALLRWLAYADAEPGSGARRRAYATTLACFALAVMSKPMAVTLPAVLLILDLWPLGRLADPARRLRVVVIEKLPFYAIACASAAVTIAAQRAGGALEMVDLAWAERLLVAERALAFYLAKLVAPITLVPLYPLPSEISPLRWDFALSGVVVVAVTAAAWLLRRRAPVVAAGWAFYLVALLPVIGLVQAGEQAAADRYTYLAMLGPLFVLGALAAASWESAPARRGTVITVAAIAVALLGARSVAQVGVWRNSFTLWEHVLRHHPESVTAHYNLGYSHYLVGDLGAAEVAYERALAQDPGYVAALNELGGIHHARGAYDLAARYLESAVAKAPEVAHYHLNLAITYEALRRFEDARRHYLAFIELAPPEQAARAAEIRIRLTGR